MGRRTKVKDRPKGRARVSFDRERDVFVVTCLHPDGAEITISKHSQPYDRMVALTFECPCPAGYHVHVRRRSEHERDDGDEPDPPAGLDAQPA